MHSSIRLLVSLAIVSVIICSLYYGTDLPQSQQQYVATNSIKDSNLQQPDITGDEEEAPYNSPNLTSDDPIVVKALKDLYLEPPSQLPYNLLHSDPEYNPSMGQAQVVDKILKQKKGGFFVECGGFDGESYSNSLIFERLRGWTGLLIEANDETYAKLKAKNRKAYISNSCISMKPHPQKVPFAKYNLNSRIVYDPFVLDAGTFPYAPAVQTAQCFPFYSYLLALNQTKIDYLSLDVEGVEYEILKNIPWDKVDISVLSIEVMVVGAPRDKITKLLEDKGYRSYSTVIYPWFMAGDDIFVKNTIYDQLSL